MNTMTTMAKVFKSRCDTVIQTEEAAESFIILNNFKNPEQVHD